MLIAGPTPAGGMINSYDIEICMHVDAFAAANRSCTIRSRSNKNTYTLAAAKNVAVTSRRIFSFTFCGGEACAHVGGITFGLLQPSIFIKWSNFVARFARVYAHPVTPGARARHQPRRPSCIIQIALSLSVCAVITSADVFVTERLASYTLGQMA